MYICARVEATEMCLNVVLNLCADFLITAYIHSHGHHTHSIPNTNETYFNSHRIACECCYAFGSTNKSNSHLDVRVSRYRRSTIFLLSEIHYILDWILSIGNLTTYAFHIVSMRLNIVLDGELCAKERERNREREMQDGKYNVDWAEQSEMQTKHEHAQAMKTTSPQVISSHRWIYAIHNYRASTWHAIVPYSYGRACHAKQNLLGTNHNTTSTYIITSIQTKSCGIFGRCLCSSCKKTNELGKA